MIQILAGSTRTLSDPPDVQRATYTLFDLPTSPPISVLDDDKTDSTIRPAMSVTQVPLPPVLMTTAAERTRSSIEKIIDGVEGVTISVADIGALSDDEIRNMPWMVLESTIKELFSHEAPRGLDEARDMVRAALEVMSLEGPEPSEIVAARLTALIHNASHEAPTLNKLNLLIDAFKKHAEFDIDSCMTEGGSGDKLARSLSS